jgi:hypothetical protein
VNLNKHRSRANCGARRGRRMRPSQGKIILATFPRGVALRKQRAADSHQPALHQVESYCGPDGRSCVHFSKNPPRRRLRPVARIGYLMKATLRLRCRFSQITVCRQSALDRRSRRAKIGRRLVGSGAPAGVQRLSRPTVTTVICARRPCSSIIANSEAT